ncbi:MAG TPA: ABC transporter substrate-binding protein [Candidatus Aquilonibacter sp.]|nr:ABC transporter substrate-binding protein [Candidatus Aquilonibacter sp.]
MQSSVSWASALLLSTALIVSGCSKQGSATAGPSGVWRIAVPINPTQLNPILAQNTIEGFIDSLMFSKLVTIDDKGNDVPDLAQVVPTQANGGISKDGLTITYHLRTNAKWHDGTPVTSKDVKFTWQAIMSTANNVLSKHGYDQIASIDTPDDHTVVMHMKHVFPPAVDTIFGESDTPYGILPAHLLAKYPNLNQIPFDAAPVGSGPFKFGRWERNDRIVLEANPDYYRGAPKLKQVVVRIVTDSNTTESLLRTHEVDLALETTAFLYNDFANAPHYVRQVVDAPSWVALFYNLKRPPLDDLAVRRAIGLAIDKTSIIDKTTYGTGTPLAADQTRFSWAYDPSLKPIPYDVTQAKALLRQDGWIPGPDGIRRKNGQRLSLQLAFGLGSPSTRNMVVLVQQMLKGVGIDLQVKGYDYQLLYGSQETGGIYNSGKFDIGVYPWVSGADPDDSSMWLCSMAPPAGNNIPKYCSSEMDAAQKMALSTFDRTRRKAAYAKVQELLLRDQPGVFLFANRLRYVHTDDLQNFTPNGVSEGWNAYQWNR